MHIYFFFHLFASVIRMQKNATEKNASQLLKIRHILSINILREMPSWLEMVLNLNSFSDFENLK